MQDARKTKPQLLDELQALRARVVELEQQAAERKRIEELLLESEARYKLLIENQGEGIGFVDADEYFLFANPAADDLFGMPRGQLISHNLSEFMDVEQFERVRRETQQRRRRQRSTYELTIQQPNGEARTIIITAVPQFDDEGQFTGTFGVFRDNTERRRIEEALRQAETQYRQLVEEVPAVTYMALAGTLRQVTYISPQVHTILGYTQAECLETPNFWLTHVHPDDRDQVANSIANAARPGANFVHEYRMLAHDGRVVWVRDVALLTTDSSYQVGTWHGVIFDITEQRQAEDEIKRLNADLEQRVIERTTELEKANAELQADIQHRQRIEEMLRRSEHRYRTLFDSAGDAIFIMDLNGKFLEVNQLACQRLGYTREELLAIGAAGINAPQFRDGLTRRIEQIRHLGSLAFESAHVQRNGTIIPIELNNRVIEYAGVPAILSIARDLTDRKHAENRLRRYADEQTVLYEIALQLNSQLNLDELLHVIVEQAVALLSARAGGIYLYDTMRDTLVLTLGVDVYHEYIGMEIKPGEELSGRAFQSRRTMKAGDYPAWERRTAGVASENSMKPVIAVPLTGKHAVPGVLFVVGDESRQEFDDHDARLVELFAAQAAIALENAQLYNAQQEQYRRLQESQSRLIQSEKMSALGRLAASIAHEINNPLQAVQGCLSLVRDGIEESNAIEPERRVSMLEDLSVAASEVARIAGIVERLRDFYRPARPGVQATDVNAIIDAVLALAANQLQHSHVAVEQTLALAGAPIVIKTNADQLKQVILNLVLNAIDAMPGGGVLQIRADTDTLNVADIWSPAVRLTFTDTGHGIPAENLARIFEPFFTTKENGSGLGLSISYDLVKMLGGEISVTSDVGVGTTFTIRLPIDAEAKDS